jgi:hypothetical protein
MRTEIPARIIFCDEANEVLKIRAAAAGVILPDILCCLEEPARRD